jgi:PAS domain S-box
MTPGLLPILTAAFAIAVFIGDTLTHLEIAVGVLNVAVVLMAARFLRRRGVVLVSVGCVGLVALSFLLTQQRSEEGYVNTLISIAAIGIVTFLVLRSQSAEVALRDQASLLSLAHDAILVRELDGTISYWNRGAEELYGWSADQAVGKRSHDLLKTISPALLEDISSEVLRAGRWEGDLTHTKRDGTKVIVSSRWALRQPEAGSPVAVLEINTDITRRKQAEEQLRKANEELDTKVIERTRDLEVANKELEAFAYSVSHDLRAPLRHLAGYTELLRKNTASMLDEKSRRYTLMILESAQRMGTLIDDLLAFSRVGRAEIQKATVSLEQIAKEALSEVRQETDGREIVWKMSALPSVHGDRSMLRLVFVNLMSNAIKFTRSRPQGTIEIGRADGKPDEIVVFVRDNGVGFDMKYIDKLFGVFQRLHRTEDFEGTGIGLATVQRIIHRHGGRVWAEGAVNEGATFYFSVPRITEG